MSVRLSLQARADLTDLGLSMLPFSESASTRLVDELTAACADLELMPGRFALAVSLEDAGVRRRVLGRHLIFYLIRDEGVFVLRILDSARDYEALLALD